MKRPRSDSNSFLAAGTVKRVKTLVSNTVSSIRQKYDLEDILTQERLDQMIVRQRQRVQLMEERFRSSELDLLGSTYTTDGSTGDSTVSYYLLMTELSLLETDFVQVPLLCFPPASLPSLASMSVSSSVSSSSVPSTTILESSLYTGFESGFVSEDSESLSKDKIITGSWDDNSLMNPLLFPVEDTLVGTGDLFSPKGEFPLPLMGEPSLSDILADEMEWDPLGWIH